MQRGQLWITRSQPGADRQAVELRQHGCQVWVAPVLDVEPVAARAPEFVADMVVFVSEHAVLAAGDLGFCGDAVLFALGARTRAVLAGRGLVATAASPASSEGLLDLPEFRQLAGFTVLLVTGADGRSLLTQQLTERGAQVWQHVCYRRVPVTHLEVNPAEVGVIITSSGDGLAAAARLWFDAGGDRNIPVLTPSERVEALGAELGFMRLVRCAGADTNAILAGLEQLRQQGER